MPENGQDQQGAGRYKEAAAAPQSSTVEYAGLKTATESAWDWRAKRRLFWFACVMLFLLPLQAIMVRLPGGFWWYGAGLVHWALSKALGLRINTYGKISQAHPTLFAANHISWLDIIILGRLLRRSAFVAKSEIEGWGVVGKIATLHRTIFVNRESRRDSANQTNRMMDHLERGDGIILFPEGTTTLGQTVDHFKSSLFGVAELAKHKIKKDVIVQPVTIAYQSINRIPFTRNRRTLVAWIGDMELMEHAQGVFESGSLEIAVIYHPPMTLSQAGSRKALAKYAEECARKGLVEANRHKDLSHF